MSALGIVFIVLFPAIGGLLIWWWWTVKSRTEAAAAWPRVAGVITQSTLSSRKQAKGGRYYVNEIRYDYRVGSEQLTGKRINFSGSSMTYDKALAERRLQQYAPGAQVDVFHDPHKPQNAVLEVSAGENRIMMLVIAAIFIAMGPILFFVVTNNP